MFYDNLKAICDERGIKITPLVAECGGAKGSISNWKKGAMPNSEIVMKLSVRLNVPTDRLLFGSETKNASISNISNSTIGVVGNHSTGMQNPNTAPDDELVKEVARILNDLPLKERTKLLTLIYDFEENYKAKKEG